jgi:hypothetical protein
MQIISVQLSYVANEYSHIQPILFNQIIWSSNMSNHLHATLFVFPISYTAVCS